MAEIVFSPEAIQDLTETGDYIAITLKNKAAAQKLVKQIRESIRILARFPQSGTPLMFTGATVLYRYIKCGNYMIFYHISEETAYIDRVLYGKRDYIAILFGDELDK